MKFLPAIFVEGHDVTLVFDASDGGEVAMSGRVNLVRKIVGTTPGLDVFGTIVPQ